MDERNNETLNMMYLKIFSELAMIGKEVDELEERLEEAKKKIGDFEKK